MIPHILPMVSGGSRPPIEGWFQASFQAGYMTFFTNSIHSVLDSSGNVYAIMNYQHNGVQTSAGGHYSRNITSLIKTNSSGVVQWHRYIYIATDTVETYGITLDSSNNVYICGRAFIEADQTVSTTYLDPLPYVMSFTSSGTERWKKYYSADTTSSPNTGSNTNQYDTQFVAIKCNTTNSNKLYVFGYNARQGSSSDSTPNVLVWLRLDPSDGTIENNRKFNVETEDDPYPTGQNLIAFDSSNNVYTVHEIDRGLGSFGMTRGVRLTKLNEGLEVVYVKALCDSGTQHEDDPEISIDSNDNFHVSFSQGYSYPKSCYAMFNSSEAFQRGLTFQVESVTGNTSFHRTSSHVLCGSTHVYLISTRPLTTPMKQELYIVKKEIGTNTIDQRFLIRTQNYGINNSNQSDVSFTDATCDGTHLFLWFSARSKQTDPSGGSGGIPQKIPWLVKLPVTDFSKSLPVTKGINWSNEVITGGGTALAHYQGNDAITIMAAPDPHPIGSVSAATIGSSAYPTTGSQDWAIGDSAAINGAFTATARDFTTLSTASTFTDSNGATVGLNTIKTDI